MDLASSYISAFTGLYPHGKSSLYNNYRTEQRIKLSQFILSISPYQMLGFLPPINHCLGDRWPFWSCSPMGGSESFWCHITTGEESLLLPHLIIFVLPLLSPGYKLLLLTTCGLIEPYFR